MAVVSAEQVSRCLRAYERALDSTYLAASTRRAYGSRVAGFLGWLRSPDIGGSDLGEGNPLVSPAVRDRAVAEYLSWLKTERAARPTTINAAATALDHFYTHLGLGPPDRDGREQDQQDEQGERRVLDGGERQRLLTAVIESGSLRDRAIIGVLLHAGLRVSELVALDLNDVRATRPARVLRVREPRRGRPRTVPLESGAVDALRSWQHDRRRWVVAGQSAYFVNHRGGRLTTRAIADLVTHVAQDADLAAGPDGRISPSTLRRTYGAQLLEQGIPLTDIAQRLGHKRTDTTLRFIQ